MSELSSVPTSKRTAKFVCQIAMFDEDGRYYSITGDANGCILEKPQGDDGFGYDPLFLYRPLNKTFAELTLEEKNDISHRGVALKKLKGTILNLISE